MEASDGRSIYDILIIIPSHSHSTQTFYLQTNGASMLKLKQWCQFLPEILRDTYSNIIYFEYFIIQWFKPVLDWKNPQNTTEGIMMKIEYLPISRSNTGFQQGGSWNQPKKNQPYIFFLLNKKTLRYHKTNLLIFLLFLLLMKIQRYWHFIKKNKNMVVHRT